jgi:hypothetical protein
MVIKKNTMPIRQCYIKHKLILERAGDTEKNQILGIFTLYGVLVKESMKQEVLVINVIHQF